jgi:3-oxoacyl-[acyl-carrier-protein] synthase-1
LSAPVAAATAILGHGLACTLGVGVGNCLHSLRRGVPPVQRMVLAVGASCPYFPIADVAGNWHGRARELIRRVIAECGGDGCRDAPLFVASSSLNVGGLEENARFPPDGQAFVEEIACWLDWRGPLFWVSSACTSSFNALLGARRLIDAGLCEQAVVLGVELRNQFTSAGFSGMQLLAADAPRPLDRDRDGLVLGEAVAALRLGRTPARWRLLGGANRVCGDNPVRADRNVLAQVLAQTLGECGLTAEQIGLVKLQAAGSPQSDAEEIAGLRRVFAPLPPLITLKASIGHTLGASGAAELALLMACLESGVWPDAVARTPDPALDANCCAALPPAPGRILANILGFGGGHCCVVIEDSASL